MTVVEVCRYRGFPISVCARGHSGYAVSGSDIVCAAISVLMQTLHIGLVDVLGLKPHVLVDAPNAFIKLTWDERSGEELRVLAESIISTLKSTAASYSKYVKIVEVSL
ncbi:MAG: ribosomal-processing cysteine protease Prp [Synergistaceae bacterium]|nr:ribosomal-processing cysteine protease Prp [Synergistaceae bacterium]